MADASLVVLGSLVVDLVVRLPHLPRVHETLIATAVERHLGGKGFNQALAAARCGARVALVACAGEDDGLAAFRALLTAEGVDQRHVRVVPGAATGLALPMVLPGGDNSIVLLPGANLAVSEADADGAEAAIRDADLVLLQQEVPPAASLRAARVARAHGTRVLLNPAPARADAAELLRACDWLVPNEVEAAALVGRPVADVDAALRAASELRGDREGVVVTLGDRGVVAVTARERLHVPAFRAEAVDPTGAGDAFCGAFAVALCEGRALADALRLGCAAGAHAVGRVGAEPGIARRAALEAMVSGGS